MPVAKDVDTGHDVIITKRIRIKAKEAVVTELADKFGIYLVHYFPLSETGLLKTPPHTDLMALVRDIENDHRVDSAELDIIDRVRVAK